MHGFAIAVSLGLAQRNESFPQIAQLKIGSDMGPQANAKNKITSVRKSTFHRPASDQ